jgi:hypothetical protein
MRCWTFTPTSFGQAAPLTMEPRGAATAAWLGHALAWDGAAPAPLPAWRASAGGAGEVLRPLVLEWRGLTASKWLAVRRGAAPLALSTSAMRLPLPVLAQSDARVGPQGHASRAFGGPAGPPDVPGLVLFDPSPLPGRGAYVNASAGLNVAIGAYGGVAPGTVRYALASGFAKLPGAAAAQPPAPGRAAASARLKLAWSDAPGQAAALVAGGAEGVTLRNGAVAAGAAGRRGSVEFWALPGSLLPLTAVVKSAGQGAGASFSAALAAVAATTDGAKTQLQPIDGRAWYRTG